MKETVCAYIPKTNSFTDQLLFWISQGSTVTHKTTCGSLGLKSLFRDWEIHIWAAILTILLSLCVLTEVA